MLINEEKNIIVLEKKELTNHIENVNRLELPKYWEKDYIHEKISQVKNYKHKMMLQFLWMTGCRITEAISIRKKDLDFKNYVITIRWQKSRKFLYRNIPLHPNLKDMLEIFTAVMKVEDVVFPMSRQRAWEIVKKTMEGHPHMFRHSFAVNWLRSGGDIVVLSRMLGHSNVNCTMEYLKIVPTDMGKELLKIPF